MHSIVIYCPTVFTQIAINISETESNITGHIVIGPLAKQLNTLVLVAENGRGFYDQFKPLTKPPIVSLLCMFAKTIRLFFMLLI